FLVPDFAGGSCAATAVAIARMVVPSIAKLRFTIFSPSSPQMGLPAKAGFVLVPNASIFPICFENFHTRTGPGMNHRTNAPSQSTGCFLALLPHFRTFDPCETLC